MKARLSSFRFKFLELYEDLKEKKKFPETIKQTYK